MINLEPFTQASPVIQIHMLAAIFAFFLGAFVLWRKKGGSSHKKYGYIWVLAMVLTAGSSFFINELKTLGNYSPIHLLSIAVFISLAMAINYARKRNIKAHKQTMQSLYLGAMGVSMVLSFMPGRILNQMFFETAAIQNTATPPSNLAWMIPISAALLSAVAYYVWDRRKRRKAISSLFH